jgi:pantoate--beta-alanine ligase
VASVFVNPKQFGPAEDLGRYPRDLERDAELLSGLGTDVLFHPSAESMYPEGFVAEVRAGPLATVLEGKERPGHFDGVCTVVLKLLHIIGPDRAYFGWKDAQQLAVLRRMVRDLDLPVEIVPVETVRDADGLALSSRNAYLGPAQRALALGLWEGLRRAREAWEAGEGDLDRIEAAARTPGLDYDYAVCVDPETFDRPGPRGPARIVAAVRVGGTRLIDNVALPARI